MNFKQLIATAALAAMAAGAMGQGIAAGEPSPAGKPSGGGRPSAGGPNHRHPIAPREFPPHGCKAIPNSPSSGVTGTPGTGSPNAKHHPRVKCGPTDKPPVSTNPSPAPKK